MSNLSELLPAGAGAKSAEFVASGTLGSGVTVALNSNGTVSVVAGNANPQDVGTLTEYSPNAEFPSACYDTDNEKIVVVYKDRDNSSYPTARVGTISGSSISFGTAVAFHSYSGSDFAVVYDKTAQRVVVAFRDSDQSYRLSAVAGVVSGTSISFGSVTTGLSSFNSEGVSGDYHATQGVVVFAWRSNQGADVFLTSRTVSTSGTTLTFGTRAEWDDYILRACKTVYDANADKMVYAVETQTGADGYALHATVSSGSISYSGEDQFSTTVSRPEIVYVSSLNKCLIVYKGTGNVLTAVVAYPAGNGVDFGAETFSTIQMDTGIQPVYDPIANKVVVLFEDNQVTPRTQNLVEISISGTTPSFSAVTNVSNVQRNGTQDAGYAGTYDAVAKRSFFTYIEDSTFDAIGFSYQVERAADSNYTDFIGITDQAIADTATGAVIVQGGVSGKAKGPITTAVGARSTFNSGSTTYPDMVYDEANQKIILSYRDDGNSGYPTAVVGTVSGTSISWGTPVIIRSSTSASGIGPKIAYDSATEQVVIAYLISDRGYAKVGKVSGASISFGAEATFEAGNTANNSIAYDTANAKVVIAYRYNTAPATDDGYAVVGTVSGTSISFGSRVLFDSGTALYTSTVYDSNTGKIVISYDSNGPKAIVGTVSGTSISFGSITTITMTLPNMTYSDLVYDAGSQKAVLFTRKSASPNNGLALVGTVSGTSISFGTEVEFTTDAINFMAATYDSTLGKVAISYEEAATDDGKMVLGTVSGTSISFTDPVIFDSTSTVNYVTAATYDPNEQVVVAGYSDSASSNFGRATAISVTTPLTIGSDYYVQADGSLSTTVSSAPAGRALSSTSILLEG